MTIDDQERPGEAESATVLSDADAAPPAGEAGSLEGRVLDGKYRVEALLGRGGMGEVYRATQLQLDRQVAVKLVLGAFRAGDAAVGRFKQEAVAVARLRHPHIVTVYDFGIADGVGAYLVMEYLDGRPLRAQVGEGPPVARVVDVMQQVCSAVQAAHEAGVIHRDLKPDNVIVADGPAAKVLDFGIAKLVEAPGKEGLTEPGAAMGTPVYMAPEQCEGKAVDARTDVYALGVMLYELLTGVPPFLEASFAQMMYKHVHVPPVPPSERRDGVPAAIEAVTLRALAKAPADRFQTAEALGRALAQALASGADDASARSTDRGAPNTEQHADADAATAIDVAHSTAPPSNLPEQATSFVGRALEVEEVQRTLRATRLLTLTGPGGIGKTRLALRVASEVARDYPDGVWLVELASLSDPVLVPGTVAGALGVQEQAGRSPLEALCDAIRAKRMLLVLDNCEHLLDACAGLASALLRVAREVRVLATSREVLGTEGEAVWAVPPLPLPRTGCSAGDLAQSDAVALLVARARLGRAGFELTERNAEAAGELCRRLEGIPLAIELAAARVRSLSIEQILAKIGARYRLLTEGPRTATARQRTLRATVDWSYDLLTEDERALLRRLSIFVGGWTLEAAEAVCAGNRIDELAVLDLLGRLVDKSLVVTEESGCEARYRMLETIREYASERLAEADEEGEHRGIHGRWFASFAVRAGAELGGARHAEALKRLEADHDNLRAAFRRCLGGECGAAEGLELTAALLRFWGFNEHWIEGRQRAEEALAAWSDGPPNLRANVLDGLAYLADNLEDYEGAGSYADECLSLRRATGEPVALASGLNLRASIATQNNAFELARSLAEESQGICRDAGLSAHFAHATFNLGMVALLTGDLGRARACLEEAIDTFRRAGKTQLGTTLLRHLGEALRLQGEYDRAAACFDEYRTNTQELGNTIKAAYCQLSYGRLLADRGEFERAEAVFSEAAATFRKEGARDGLANLVESWALAFARRGEPALAACLEAAAASARRAFKVPRPPVEQDELDRILSPSLLVLRGEEVERARARGAAMTLEEAVDAARAAAARP